MLFSVYPTDAALVRDAVVAQAVESQRTQDAVGAEASKRGDEAFARTSLFTSLHLPEVAALRDFLEWMREVHERHGLTFWADISPHTLTVLDASTEELELASYGVTGVRIDFGFADEQVRAFAASGLRIAVNASTITPSDLDALADLRPVGWHNFYPRPGTGLARSFYVDQSALFVERGLPVVSFVPGETSWRAPLHLGLPTLEPQRHRNAYLNAAELLSLVPATELVCAEGTLLPQHLEWIAALESGVVTLPLVGVDAGAAPLFDGTWTLRAEQSGISQRLEGSRGRFGASAMVNGDRRALGSIQVDLDAAGRYAGEVHMMASEQPLDPWQGRLADLAAPYAPLAGWLRGRQTVRFVRFPGAGAAEAATP